MFCILNLWCYMFNLYCHGVRGLFHFVVFSSTEILNVIEFSSIFLYDVYFYILNPLLRIMKISLMFSVPCFAVLLFILKYLIYVTLIILFSLIRCGVVWPVILERLTNLLFFHWYIIQFCHLLSVYVGSVSKFPIMSSGSICTSTIVPPDFSFFRSCPGHLWFFVPSYTF